MNPKKIRRVILAPHIIEEALTKGSEAFRTVDVPPDLRVLDAWHRLPSVSSPGQETEFVLLVQSESFDEVPQGEKAPLWTPLFQTASQEVRDSLDAVIELLVEIRDGGAVRPVGDGQTVELEEAQVFVDRPLTLTPTERGLWGEQKARAILDALIWVLLDCGALEALPAAQFAAIDELAKALQHQLGDLRDPGAANPLDGRPRSRRYDPTQPALEAGPYYAHCECGVALVVARWPTPHATMHRRVRCGSCNRQYKPVAAQDPDAAEIWIELDPVGGGS